VGYRRRSPSELTPWAVPKGQSLMGGSPDAVTQVLSRRGGFCGDQQLWKLRRGAPEGFVKECPARGIPTGFPKRNPQWCPEVESRMGFPKGGSPRGVPQGGSRRVSSGGFPWVSPGPAPDLVSSRDPNGWSPRIGSRGGPTGGLLGVLTRVGPHGHPPGALGRLLWKSPRGGPTSCPVKGGLTRGVSEGNSPRGVPQMVVPRVVHQVLSPIGLLHVCPSGVPRGFIQVGSNNGSPMRSPT
jgi:hypothetical protein